MDWYIADTHSFNDEFCMDWFTADTHAFHDNIVKHCYRPFKNGLEMAESLARAINHLVVRGDRLYHLGDFAWKGKAHTEQFRSMIDCKDIVLLRGNHDYIKLGDTRKLFTKIADRYSKGGVTMTHEPLETWTKMNYGQYHLHGHCHGNLPEHLFKLRIDAGVDVWGYKPISRDEVEDIMQAKLKTMNALRPVFQARGHHFVGLAPD